MRKSEIVALWIVLLSLVIGIYLSPQMPERMASHWNSQGQVDGYLPRFWGLAWMPFISFGLFLLFVLIPIIDPLRANIEKFRKHFDRFVMVMFLFLLYLYLLIILWNLGIKLEIIPLFVPAFGVLFYYAGILIENTKRNWFIGIKTPWAMSSERVWNKTHKIGGKLFKIAGGVSLLGILFPVLALFFILAPVLLAVVYLVVYSYTEYKKERE